MTVIRVLDANGAPLPNAVVSFSGRDIAYTLNDDASMEISSFPTGGSLFVLTVDGTSHSVTLPARRGREATTGRLITIRLGSPA